MRAPTRPRCESRSGCAATSGGSRTISHGATVTSAELPAIDAPSYVLAAPEHDTDDETTEWHPIVIAESTTALKRLSVSEAVMELDLRGAAVMVFRHAGHGRINLVYRRADGHIGWIDPPPIESDAH